MHNGALFSKNVGMNKRELAKSVAVQADVELKTVAAVLDGFTDVVTAVVSKGEPVSIPGLPNSSRSTVPPAWVAIPLRENPFGSRLPRRLVLRP